MIKVAVSYDARDHLVLCNPRYLHFTADCTQIDVFSEANICVSSIARNAFIHDSTTQYYFSRELKSSKYITSDILYSIWNSEMKVGSRNRYGFQIKFKIHINEESVLSSQQSPNSENLFF